MTVISYEHRCCPTRHRLSHRKQTETLFDCDITKPNLPHWAQMALDWINAILFISWCTMIPNTIFILIMIASCNLNNAEISTPSHNFTDSTPSPIWSDFPNISTPDPTSYSANYLSTEFYTTNEPRIAPSETSSPSPSTAPTRFPTQNVDIIYDVEITMNFSVHNLTQQNKEMLIDSTSEMITTIVKIIELCYFDGEDDLTYQHFWVVVYALNGVNMWILFMT